MLLAFCARSITFALPLFPAYADEQVNIIEWYSLDYQVTSGDFNGDELKDLLLQPLRPEGLNLVSYGSLNSESKVEYLFENTQSTPIEFSKQFWHSGHQLFTTGDFNGDGFEDLLTLYRSDLNKKDRRHRKVEGYVFSGSENGLNLEQFDFKLKNNKKLPFLDFPENYEYHAGDFNGDGKDDLFVQFTKHIQFPDDNIDISNANHYVVLSNKKGKIKKVKQSISLTELPWLSAQFNPIVGDFNSDGRDDIFVQQFIQGSNHQLISSAQNGELLTMQPVTITDDLMDLSWNATDVTLFPYDVNEDNILDLMRINTTETNTSNTTSARVASLSIQSMVKSISRSQSPLALVGIQAISSCDNSLMSAGSYFDKNTAYLNPVSGAAAISGCAVDFRPIPDTPSSISVPLSNTTGSFNVSWTRVLFYPTPYYKLYQSKNSGSYSYLGSTSKANLVVSGLTNGTYRYRVRACYAERGAEYCSGYKYSSNTYVSIPVPPPPPVAPALSALPAYSLKGVHLSWSLSANANSFEVWRSANGAAYSKWATFSGSTSSALGGLAAGQNCFKVRGVNTQGNGGFSNIRCTTLNNPPAVSLLFPSAGHTFGYRDSVYASASANDNNAGDSISKVTLSVPGIGAFNDTSAPYVHVFGTLASGTYTIKADAYDARGGSSGSSRSFTVKPNQAPSIAQYNGPSIAEDNTLVLNTNHFNISDEDDVSFTLYVYSGSNYTFSGTSITPAVNYDGSISVKVRVKDRGGLYSPYFYAPIDITPVNDAPNVTSYKGPTIAEDSSLALSLSHFNIADVDSSSFTLYVYAGTNYTVSGNTITSSTSNYNGSLSVKVRVKDSAGAYSPYFYTPIDITPVNDAPTVTSYKGPTIAEDSSLALSLSHFNIADVDRSSFTLYVYAGTNYTVSGNTITSSTSNYNGSLSVKVRVKDSAGAYSPYFYAPIDITPVNDAPLVINDNLNVTEDIALARHVTTNDIDVDGDILAIFLVGVGSHGVAEKFSSTAIKYIPTSNYCGEDSFTYVVSDGNGGTATGTVSVNITCVNDLPVITGTPLLEAKIGQLYSFRPMANDVDGDVLTFSIQNKPSWATFDTASGLLEGTPKQSDFGTFNNIIIHLSDGAEQESLDPFDIEVATVLEDIPDATILTLTRPETTDIVGQLQGNATVSGGNVNYSIPIQVPPGRQGMQPVLSFQYNSAQRNGLLGVGWSVSGQSSISRCNANWTEDNRVDRVDLQSNDLLCLNGQKLVLVSGSYGGLGSEYRTLHDSFSKVTLLGGTYSSTASYFKVISKSGQESYYGESADSTLIPADTTTPFNWSISKVYDNAETQNNMVFTYSNVAGEQLLTDIYYTGQADSSGNRRVQFDYEERADTSFNYIAGGSTKITQRLSSITTYVGSTKIFDYDLVYEALNSPITDRSRLASIKQCGFESATEKCLPKKEFTYSGDTLEFDEVESTNVVFNSSSPWSMENQILGDFNNDGVTDFARGDQLHLMSFEDNQYVIDSVIDTPFAQYNFSTSGNVSLREDIKLGQLDFNNDGQLDLIGINTSGNLSIAMFDITNDAFEQQDLGIAMECSVLTTKFYLYNYEISVGKTTKYRNACRAEPISDGTGGYYLFHRSHLSDMYLSRIHPECSNNICSTQLISGIDKTGPSLTTYYHAEPADYQFFDFDGDGDPDIVRLEEVSQAANSGIKFVWFRNDQTGTGTSATNNFVKIIETLPTVTKEYGMGTGGNHWIDANGDGLKDLLVNSDNWYLFINQGGTLSAPIDTGINKFERSNVCFMNCNSSGPEHTTHPSIRIVDFNSDGLQDFMFLDRNVNQRDCYSDRERAYCKEGKGSESPSINDSSISPLAFGRYSVYLSSVNSTGTVSFTKQETNIQGSMNYLYPVDMNNDGTMDFIGAIWQDDQTTIDSTYHSQETYFYLGQSDSNGIAPDLLTLAQDDIDVSSFGQKDEFEYQSLSQHKKSATGSATIDNSDLAGKYYYRIPSTQMVAVQHKTKNNNAGTNTIEYVYGDPIYHQAGLGFLGFESIKEINKAQGTTSISSYLMDYPLNGKLDQLTLIETADDTVLKSQTNIWCNITTTACDSKETGVYFAHLESSLSNYFDPDGNAIKTEIVTNNSFDDYGNTIQQTKVISDSSTTHTTVVDNEYIAADEAAWWLDKLDYSEVTKSVSYSIDKGIVVGTNGNKVQRRTVTWKENEARQLATETLTASDTELVMVSTYNAYDEYGNLTKVTRSGNAVAGTDYTDVQSNQILEHNFADSNGYFVNWQKNGLWANNAVTHTWDTRFGKMLTQVDINSLTLTNHYDAFGRIIQVDSSNSPTLDMIYQWCSDCAINSVYSLTSMQDGAPTVVEAFNRIGQTLHKTSQSFANNATTNQLTIERFAYDALGRLTTHTLPHFSWETASTETLGSYDVLSRATTKTVNNHPQNYTTTYTFSGLKTSISVNAGGDGVRSMARTYNALNQLISSTDANTNSTYFHYDANGNAIFIMDVLDNIISAQYDGLNNKLWFDDLNFGRREFRYNALGQMRWQDDANSDEIRFDYDSLGRQTKRYVNGATHATWTYDTRKKGVLSSLNSNAVNKDYYYDAQVRVVRETSEIHNQLTTREFNVGYSYDAYYGRVKGTSYPSGEVVATQYDQYGYKTANIDYLNNATYRTVNSLTSQGKIKQQQLGNGLYNIASFARSGEMSRVCVNNSTACGGSNSLDEISYSSYDNFGNLKTVNNVINEISESYVYDSLHRINSATRSANGIISPEFLPTATIDYDYDAAGNLTLKSDYASAYSYANNGTLTGGPNAVKSVTKLNGSQVNFTYDNNGNLTAGDGLSISYNHFNKPINIIRNNVTLAFSYDGDEQRAVQVAQHANKTVSTYYVGKLFEQVETTINGNTAVEQRDYLGGYAIISHTDSSRNVRYLHRDRLGSVSMISDGDQHIDDVNAKEELVLERKGYDVFGKPRDLYWSDGLGGILASNITNRGFTDHEHLDSAQLIHMNGRGYDYNLGRFLSVDPFIQFPEGSQSLNPYSYLMNNPLAGTDPSGYTSTWNPVGGFLGPSNGSWGHRGKNQQNTMNIKIGVGKIDIKDIERIDINSVNKTVIITLKEKVGTNQSQSFLSQVEDGFSSALGSATEAIKSSDLYKDNEMLINFIDDEWVNVLLRTGQTLGGGGQVLLGGMICYGSGGLACAGGAIIAAKGGDNIYSGLSGNQSVSESFLQKTTGNKTAGTLINAGLDIGTSVIGLIRATPKIHELGEPMRHLMRKDPYVSEAAWKQTVKPLLRLEATTATGTVADTLMKTKQNQ
jgi:RHS repeat-associated protein